MNLQILAADIVRRVQRSPDSSHNLSEVVANLMRSEIADLKKQLAENLAVLQKEHEKYVMLGRAVIGEGSNPYDFPGLTQLANEQRELAEMFREKK